MLYRSGFAFPEGSRTATKPITSANGTMATTKLFFISSVVLLSRQA
jgi:hypothetical protein